jgi:pilus assembly protein TadC
VFRNFSVLSVLSYFIIISPYISSVSFAFILSFAVSLFPPSLVTTNFCTRKESKDENDELIEETACCHV